MFFEKSDLEMSIQDIYPLSDKDRKIAELPCVEVSDDTVQVMSQTSATTMHTVLHDGEKPIMCDCTWSTYHPVTYKYPDGVEIEGNDCKSHFRRVNMALEKRRARIAAVNETQHRVEVNVEVQASVDVKPTVRGREESPLHVKTFKII